MSQVILTEVSQGDPRPLSINPDHVVSLRPRKVITPVDAQQDPRGDISYSGTIVSLVTGANHFVSEDFAEVHDQVLAGRTPEDVPGLEQEVAPSSPSESGGSTPPKKAPAKKAAAKAADPEPEPEPTPVIADAAEDMTATAE